MCESYAARQVIDAFTGIVGLSGARARELTTAVDTEGLSIAWSGSLESALPLWDGLRDVGLQVSGTDSPVIVVTACSCRVLYSLNERSPHACLHYASDYARIEMQRTRAHTVMIRACVLIHADICMHLY